MRRLKDAGLWGLAIVLFIVALPISIVSFVITTKLMFLLLGVALAVAVVGYVVLLPATVAAGLLGQGDSPKVVFGAAAVVVVLIVAGLTWFSLDQRAKPDVVEAGLIAEVRAGEQILCDHPESSASRPTYLPADMLQDAVRVHGWTCWAGGDDVYHPPGEEPFLDRFQFPYD